MPRIRKQTEEQVVTYSVLDRETSSSDFPNDPDMFRDPLPQPYRRIDKILQELIDDVWNVLEKNETERKIESSKPRAPKYSPLSVLEGMGNFNCLSQSSDDNNEFLFVGSNGSVYCIDVSALCVIDKLELSLDNNANITSIYSSKLKESVHLVVSISDTGFMYMSLFVTDKFYSVQSFTDGDADKKNSYRKCEVSKNCDYVAFFLDSKSNLQDCSIEVYKCPKDTWLQTIETLESKKQQQQLQVILNEGGDNEAVNTDGAQSSFENYSDQKNHQDEKHANFARPTLICKLKPPANQFKFQTVNASNLTQIIKSVETSPDLIGLGINNCISKSYIDLKNQFAEKIFNIQLNEESSNQLNGTKNYDFHLNKINADFKFFPANRIVPSHVDQHQNDTPLSIGVCWNNCNQLLFYPLGKVTKDLESKLEYCIPFSSQITLFEATKCNNLIALALKNNNIIVFDLNSGLARKCSHIRTSEAIKQIHFLPISVPNNSILVNLSAQIKVDTRLVCLCDDGSVYIIDCSLASNQDPQLIFSPKLANHDDKIAFILPFKNTPKLLMAISETRKVYMLNLDTGNLICELDNSEDKFMLDSDNYQVAYNSKNQQFFLKCIRNEKDASTLLCHSLKLIPILDSYLSAANKTLNTCLPLNATLTERVKNLLKIKIEEQASRKERLKSVWAELSQHKNKQQTKI